MLQLLPAVVQRLEHLARDAYPEEACGLLVGERDGGKALIRRATVARNLSERAADRYVLDPDDYLAADEAARRDGLEILGIWHTHPDHPAVPSATDRELAWEGFAYLILAVGRRGMSDRRCWSLEGDEFVERPLGTEQRNAEPEQGDVETERGNVENELGDVENERGNVENERGDVLTGKARVGCRAPDPVESPT